MRRFKVGEGGSRSNSQVFFNLNLKIWIMPRFELFTEFKKLSLLPSYDVVKFGTTCSFCGI